MTPEQQVKMDKLKEIANKQFEELNKGLADGSIHRRHLEDPVNMANWYPKLEHLASTPKTIQIDLDQDTLGDYVNGENTDRTKTFSASVKEAADMMGYPCFLRSGIMSGKHSWNGTCFIENKDINFNSHIYKIIECNAMAWGVALPTSFFVREMITTAPAFHAFRGLMPVTKERRYFFNGGVTICHHPYWPSEAIEGNTKEDWENKLISLNNEHSTEITHLTELTDKVAKHFEGFWSLDWLQDINGKWYAIDMAPGAKSYHWKDCEWLKSQGEKSS